jgi:hypothetical protein
MPVGSLLVLKHNHDVNVGPFRLCFFRVKKPTDDRAGFATWGKELIRLQMAIKLQMITGRSSSLLVGLFSRLGRTIF